MNRIRRPRFSVFTAMMLVAVVAILFGTALAVQRHQRAARIAELEARLQLLEEELEERTRWNPALAAGYVSVSQNLPLQYEIQKTRWELKEMGVSEPSATTDRD